MVATRKCSRALYTLAVVGVFWGCGGSEGRKELADGGDAGVVMPPVDAASMPDATASDARTGDAQMDAVVVGTAPVLTTVRVLQAGRFGHDLRIEVTGSDADGDGVAVRLELFDSSGTRIAFRDTDGNGTKDTNPALVPFVAPLGKMAGSTAYASMALLFREFPMLKRAKLEVVDDRGNSSESRELDISAQPVLALGQQCDAKFVENRCQNGLGCKGTLPTSCMMGEKPVITRSGYYSDELGRRVLIEGTDADDDVNSYTVEFLDAQGQPMTVDLDGELGDEPPKSSLTETVDVTAGSGKFFFRFDPSEFFVDAVKKVRVRVKDLGENSSEAVIKTLNDTDLSATSTGAPTRSTGQTCDARGFDRCATSAVCTTATATATATTCVALNTARTRTCQAALVLEPFKSVMQVRGEIKEPSLWDPPEGCATNDPKFQADAVIKLVLTRPVSRLVLSTSNPYTSFDTTMYMLTSCTAPANAAWCADDQVGTAPNASRAVLELTGPIPAQDYYVVVDSFPGATTANKTFQVDVQITE